MQRLHDDDLSGYLHKKGGWQTLDLPAIAEKTSIISGYIRREGEALHPKREDLKQLKKQSMIWAATHFQHNTNRNQDQLKEQ